MEMGERRLGQKGPDVEEINCNKVLRWASWFILSVLTAQRRQEERREEDRTSADYQLMRFIQKRMKCARLERAKMRFFHQTHARQLLSRECPVPTCTTIPSTEAHPENKRKERKEKKRKERRKCTCDSLLTQA